MSRLIYLLFGVLIGIDTFIQIAFKITGEKTAPATFDGEWLLRIVNEPWALLILCGYAAAFVTYMTLIRTVHIGPAFAASHLEIVAVLVVSVLWFDERFTTLQALGCLAILGGVAVLAFTEQEDEPQIKPAPAE